MGLMSLNTYTNTVKANTEFLTSDVWELEIIKKPELVYYPGTDIFKIQVGGVDGLKLPSHTPLVTNIRGFPVIQSGNTTEMQLQDITVTLADTTDQTFFLFLLSYMRAIQNPITMARTPIEGYRMEWKFYQLDALRRPVRVWTVYGATITDTSYDNTLTAATDIKTLGGDVSFTLQGYVIASVLTV